MKYVPLGSTGLNVSALGFGGIPIQRLEQPAINRLFDRLVELGVNYIDTARGYTVSEVCIGKAIAGRRDRFVLATKSMARDKAGMAADIETSLKNLQTDYIDLYQVHNPTADQLKAVCAPGGALEALLEAKQAGKIGHIGLTGHTMAVFEAALQFDWVETFMFPYNIVETQCTEKLPLLKAQGKAFIAMKPMAGGAIPSGRDAMRFLAADENVTVVIPGMDDPAQVTENAEALCDTAPLSAEESARFEAIRKELGSEFCRRCGYCAPCTKGIDIPAVFTLLAYKERYNLAQWAEARYAAQAHKADECIACGKCEGRCPYSLPIRRMLAHAHEVLK